MGGSVGKSKSKSDPSSVWGGQAPYLQDLYKQTQQTGQGNAGQQYGQQFEQGSLDAFNQQAAGGAGYDTSALQGMANGTAQNTALNGAITAGLDQMGQNFNRNIMPGIDQGAAAAGTAGGSRQGIAQGMAANDANLASSQFINQMQSDNFNNILQSQTAAGGVLNQYSQMRNQAQQGAMSAAAGGLANLGFGNQYGNLNSLAQLYGNPAILGGGSKSTQTNLSGGLFGG